MSSSKPITLEAVTDKYLELLDTYVLTKDGADRALREANFIRSVSIVKNEAKQNILLKVKDEMFDTSGTHKELESKIYKESEIGRLKQMRTRYLDGDENKLSDWERLTVSSMINVVGFDTNTHYTVLLHDDEKARAKTMKLIDEAQFTVWDQLRPYIKLNSVKGDSLNPVVVKQLPEMKDYIKDNALALHTIYQLYTTCEAKSNDPEFKAMVPNLLKLLKADENTTPDQRIQNFNDAIIKDVLKKKKVDFKKQQSAFDKVTQWAKPKPPLLAFRHELNTIYKDYEKQKPKMLAPK